MRVSYYFGEPKRALNLEKYLITYTETPKPTAWTKLRSGKPTAKP